MAPDAVSPRNARVFAALAAARIILFTVFKLFTPLIIRSVLDMCSTEALLSSCSDFSEFVIDTAPELPSIVSASALQLCTTAVSVARPYLPQGLQDFDLLAVISELLLAMDEFVPEPPIKFCVLGSGIGCGPARRRRTISDLAEQLVSYFIDKARLPHGLLVDVFSKVFSGTRGVIVCSVLLLCCFVSALAWSLWTLNSFETPLDEDEIRIINKVDAALALTINKALAILDWFRRRNSTALTSIFLLYHAWMSVHFSAKDLFADDGVFPYGKLSNNCRRVFSLVLLSPVTRHWLVAGVLVGILGVVCYGSLLVWVIWAAYRSRAELAITRPAICNLSVDQVHDEPSISEVPNMDVVATPEVAIQVDASTPLSLSPERDSTVSKYQSPDVAGNSAPQLAQEAELQSDEASNGATRSNQSDIPSLDAARDNLPRVLARTLSSRFPEDYYINPEFAAKYELLNELGAGTFGFVLQARCREDGRQVAVKFVSKTQDIPCLSIPWHDHPKHGRVPQEVKYLGALRHENIIEMLDVYSSDTYVYIVQELHGDCWLPKDESWLQFWPSGGNRSLFGYLAQNGPMPLEDAKYVFKQLARVERYLYMNGISHCDLKPENLVIDKNLKIKLIDFGSAKCANRKKPLRPFYTHRGMYGGTRIYVPPEIHEGKPYQTAPGDVWALGTILYHMLTGERPFWDVEMIKRGEIACDPSRIENWDSLLALWPVIRGCLELDPQRRLSPTQLFSHPCLK